MSVDALLEVIHQRGMKLANLFELDNGRWQANVSNGIDYWEFGRGGSPDEAILAALGVAARTPKPVRIRVEPKLESNNEPASFEDAEL